MEWPKGQFLFCSRKLQFKCGDLPCPPIAYYEDSDYPNYAMVKVPSNLCHVKRGCSCACNLQHTQLFEYKRLLVICTATTEGGKLFSTLKHIPSLDTPDYKVFTTSTKCLHWKNTKASVLTFMHPIWCKFIFNTMLAKFSAVTSVRF